MLGNHPDLEPIAKEAGLPFAWHSSENPDQHFDWLIKKLAEIKPDLVVLARYMRILPAKAVQAYRYKIINIHPSLLPSFPGLDAQQQAFEYGVKIAGCTVHFVDEAVDHGVIVLQKTVAVLEEDTVETLSARILEQEHIAYPEAIAQVLRGTHGVVGRRYLPV